MSKVGLKDTLSLLAKGYSKKEIDALAAYDEETEKEAAAQEEKKPEAPAPEEDKKEEPDYKAMYEDLLKKNKETEETIKKIQKENVNSDSTPATEEILRKQQEDLSNLVRSFM